MARRGRPHALNEIKRGEIVALISAGCSVADAARYVDCAVSTIDRDAGRNPAFHRRMREAHLAAELKPLQALRQAAGQHWRAAAWLLQRVNPDRYVKQKEGTYDELDIQDLMSQLLHCVTPDISDRNAWERIAKRFDSVLSRWEHERVEARAILRPHQRRRKPRTSELDEEFPVLGHAVYKAEEPVPQALASGTALVRRDAARDRNKAARDRNEDLTGDLNDENL